MTIKLSDELTLYSNSFFPKIYAKRSYDNLAIIGVGGNLGNSIRRFIKLIKYLKDYRGIKVLQTSFILKNPPFGFLKQNFFFNTILVVETKFRAFRLLKHLLKIEKRFKRIRRFKNAPRSLDLDIIFYNDQKIEKKDLVVPHPKWDSRDSVKIPLFLLDWSKL